MRGRAPLVPRIGIAVVDVRDVAAAHIAALKKPGVVGRRFITTAEGMRFLDFGIILGEAFPDRKRRMPRGELPDFLVRLAGIFDPTARNAAAELGSVPHFSNESARELLGVRFRSGREAIVAMAESLITLGMA
jgi:dihydroflavonol-4-reductase